MILIFPTLEAQVSGRQAILFQGCFTSPAVSMPDRGDADRELSRPESWRRKPLPLDLWAPEGVVAGVSSVSS